MIYRARDSLMYDLLSMPETGMGYQLIDAKRKDMISRERFIVYNSELIIDLDSKFKEFQNQIIKESFSKVLSKVDFLPLYAITVVKSSEVREPQMLTERKKKEKHRYSGGQGAIDSPTEHANGKELFVRLSAYLNDKRIDFDNKRLKPGTFATTNTDYTTCVRYSDDPIDRYALPNDDEIKWAFYVQPKSYDSLKRGIVQPAFGHDGGGVEVYFKKGTSRGTYLDKRPYGE